MSSSAVLYARPPVSFHRPRDPTPQKPVGGVMGTHHPVIDSANARCLRNGDARYVISASTFMRKSETNVIGSHTMHDRSRMTIDVRLPSMPGRSTSGFHRRGAYSFVAENVEFSPIRGVLICCLP